MKYILRRVLGCLPFFIGIAAGAQDIVLDANFAVTTFYDDRFEVAIEDSNLAGIRYQPSATFSYEGQTYQSELGFRAVYNDFLDPAFNDNTNFNISWDNSRSFERSSIQFGVTYNERLLEDFVELDDLIEVSRSDEVQVLSLNPAFSYSLSQRTQIFGTYQFSQTSLQTTDANTGVSGEDFDSQTATFGLQRALSEKSTLSFFASYTSFLSQSEFADQETAVFGFSVGGSRVLKNGWELSGSFGGQQVDVVVAAPGQFDTLEDGQVILTADLEASRSSGRSTTVISATAGTSQQLDGVVDNQQGVGFSWSRDLSQKLSSNTNLRYFRADRSGRQDYSLTAGLDWRSSPRWSYSVNYQFRDLITSAGGRDEGPSNRVTLRINYSFRDLVLN